MELVVQHWCSPRRADIAALLLVSKSCRSALQQAVGDLHVWVSDARTLSAFCAWLPSHAGLVNGLTIAERGMDAEYMLASAFCRCMQAAGHAGSGAAAARLHNSSHKPAALQLKSLTLGLWAPAVLRPLAAVSTLTSLRLGGDVRCELASCAALGQLTSLKRLRCYALSGSSDEVKFSLASAMGQLQRLSSLELGCSLPVDALQRLPAQLRLLDISTARAGAPSALRLQHLTSLQQLSIKVPGGIAAAAQWPPALTSLTIVGAAEALAGLPVLKRLKLHNPSDCWPILQQLSGLSSVQDLGLRLEDCPEHELPSVFESVAAATQLVRLMLMGDEEVPYDETRLDLHGLEVSSHLTQLTRLQKLRLVSLDLDPDDALDLQHLSSLTTLHLNTTDGFGDLGMAAVVGAQTNLRQLFLQDCELQTATLWAVLGRVTTLEVLHVLHPAPKLTDATLQLLRPLTRLEAVHIGEQQGGDGQDVSGEARMAFQGAMPRLTSLQVA
jgi:hypothetical protein